MMPLLSRRSGPSGSHQTFTNGASIENRENSFLDLNVAKHKDLVKKIFEAKDSCPKINSNDFKLKPIGTIKTPEGQKQIFVCMTFPFFSLNSENK